MPARNHAMSIIATISDDIPLMIARAQSAGFFASRSAARIENSVGTQKAMGRALPLRASHIMPINSTANGSVNPNNPPLNSTLSLFSRIMANTSSFCYPNFRLSFQCCASNRG